MSVFGRPPAPSRRPRAISPFAGGGRHRSESSAAQVSSQAPEQKRPLSPLPAPGVPAAALRSRPGCEKRNGGVISVVARGDSRGSAGARTLPPALAGALFGGTKVGVPLGPSQLLANQLASHHRPKSVSQAHPVCRRWLHYDESFCQAEDKSCLEDRHQFVAARSSFAYGGAPPCSRDGPKKAKKLADRAFIDDEALAGLAGLLEDANLPQRSLAAADWCAAMRNASPIEFNKFLDELNAALGLQSSERHRLASALASLASGEKPHCSRMSRPVKCGRGMGGVASGSLGGVASHRSFSPAASPVATEPVDFAGRPVAFGVANSAEKAGETNSTLSPWTSSFQADSPGCVSQAPSWRAPSPDGEEEGEEEARQEEVSRASGPGDARVASFLATNGISGLEAKAAQQAREALVAASAVAVEGQGAVGDFQLAQLRSAINEASQACLQEREVAPAKRVLQQLEVDAARRSLAVAAQKRTIPQLREAIDQGAARLSEPELAPARALLQEIEDNHALAQGSLDQAMKQCSNLEDADLLRVAIERAEQASLPDRDIDAARRLLLQKIDDGLAEAEAQESARCELERRHQGQACFRKELDGARRIRDTSRSRCVFSIAPKATWLDVQDAREYLQQVDVETAGQQEHVVARNALHTTIAARNADCLRSAVDGAHRVLLPSAEVEPVHLLMEKLEVDALHLVEQTAAQRELDVAIASRNIEALRLAILQVERSRLHDSAANSARQVLRELEEGAEQARRQDAARSTMREAETARDVPRLRMALHCAIESGLSEKEMEPIGQLILELEFEAILAQERAQASLFLATAVCAEDIEKLRAAVERASAAGLSDSESLPAKHHLQRLEDEALRAQELEAEAPRVQARAQVRQLLAIAISEDDIVQLRTALEQSSGVGLVDAEVEAAEQRLQILEIEALKAEQQSKARCALDYAIRVRDVRQLRSALDVAKEFHCSYSEISSGKQMLQELEAEVRQTEIQEMARRKLDEAVHSRNRSLLQKVMDEAEKVCLPEAELEASRRVFQELEREVRQEVARETLDAAVLSKDPSRLRFALDEAWRVWLPHTLTAPAERLLFALGVQAAEAAGKEAALDALRAAVTSQEVAHLKSALQQAATVQLSENEALDVERIKDLLAALEVSQAQAEAQAAARSYLSSKICSRGPVSELQAALENGASVRLDDCELEPARYLLQELQQEARQAELRAEACSALAEAAESGSVTGLRAAIGRAAAAGLDEESDVGPLRLLLREIEQEEMQSCLQAAIEAKDADRLRNAIDEAVKAGFGAFSSPQQQQGFLESASQVWRRLVEDARHASIREAALQSMQEAVHLRDGVRQRHMGLEHATAEWLRDADARRAGLLLHGFKEVTGRALVMVSQGGEQVRPTIQQVSRSGLSDDEAIHSDTQAAATRSLAKAIGTRDVGRVRAALEIAVIARIRQADIQQAELLLQELGEEATRAEVQASVYANEPHAVSVRQGSALAAMQDAIKRRDPAGLQRAIARASDVQLRDSDIAPARSLYVELLKPSAMSPVPIGEAAGAFSASTSAGSSVLAESGHRSPYMSARSSTAAPSIEFAKLHSGGSHITFSDPIATPYASPSWSSHANSTQVGFDRDKLPSLLGMLQAPGAFLHEAEIVCAR